MILFNRLANANGSNVECCVRTEDGWMDDAHTILLTYIPTSGPTDIVCIHAVSAWMEQLETTSVSPKNLKRCNQAGEWELAAA
jgi:hypothetical protein